MLRERQSAKRGDTNGDDGRDTPGINGSGSIETTAHEQWDAMMEINVRAQFRLMRVAPELAVANGSIVNVSSDQAAGVPGVLG